MRPQPFKVLHASCLCKFLDFNVPSMAQWHWIGHVLCKDANFITKVAIHWTQEDKRMCGRPKTTWLRTVEAELKKMNHSWGIIQRLALTDRGGGASLLPYTPAGVTVVMK